MESQPLFDPFALRTTARAAGGGYALDGVKSLVPRAADAEVFVVAAELENVGPSLFIVESKTDGISVEPEPGMITGMTLYMVQDGPLVLLAAVVGGEDPTGMVRSWIELMLDREVSEEAIELKDDGTSTGGVFALMPTADDAAQLGGMVPITDIDLLDTSSE